MNEPEATSTRPLRDPSLPHQIVIYSLGNYIAVSCNCLTNGIRNRYPIEARMVFPAPAIFAAYEAWHLLRDIDVQEDNADGDH